MYEPGRKTLGTAQDHSKMLQSFNVFYVVLGLVFAAPVQPAAGRQEVSFADRLLSPFLHRLPNPKPKPLSCAHAWSLWGLHRILSS